MQSHENNMDLDDNDDSDNDEDDDDDNDDDDDEDDDGDDDDWYDAISYGLMSCNVVVGATNGWDFVTVFVVLSIEIFSQRCVYLSMGFEQNEFINHCKEASKAIWDGFF